MFEWGPPSLLSLPKSVKPPFLSLDHNNEPLEKVPINLTADSLGKTNKLPEQTEDLALYLANFSLRARAKQNKAHINSSWRILAAFENSLLDGELPRARCQNLTSEWLKTKTALFAGIS